MSRKPYSAAPHRKRMPLLFLGIVLIAILLAALSFGMHEIMIG